ncbi:hypothetical protein E2C01_096827 [Portunus trituberculatus]|uniref:Uncharacterized protein n=1 Tax=Portunus trituberculatus TaxID=210409 RepID=A0A5B7K444_PORTR|nr:hypothetical protein [Portunus trituberculatus]
MKCPTKTRHQVHHKDTKVRHEVHHKGTEVREQVCVYVCVSWTKAAQREDGRGSVECHLTNGTDYYSAGDTHGTEHLIPVCLHAAKGGHQDVRADVPHAQGMVLADGEQQVGVPWVELQFIDGVPMTCTG